RARYDKPIRGTVPRTVPRSGAACGQHPAEQERDAPLGLRPDPGVQFDGLEQRALDPVAVFGEVPADAFGGVAGGGVRDDALRAPVGDRGDHGRSPAADPDHVGFGQVLQDVRGGAVDDLELDAVPAGGGVGAGAGPEVAVDGEDGGAGPGGLGREEAAASSELPGEGARAGSEAGELGEAQQFPLALAEAAAVGLGGQGPAARAGGGVASGDPAGVGGAGGAADDDDDVGVAPGVVGGLVGGDHGDLFAGGAEFLADHEGAVDALHEQAQFGGPGAGRGQDGHLGVGPADVHRAAQGARVGDHHLGVVPGHSGPGEGGGHRGDGG